ncbi:MAG: thioredoxin domain-containing protein [Smithellaceae bacterium]|jgi:uncharacterized membrane protein
MFYRKILQHRLPITVAAALAGIGIMAYYATCNTGCSYLRGDILGIDLKYVGVGYMGVIILLALFRQADLLRMLVAAGIGVEAFLISFQFREEVFCPFCLAFGALVILMYLINYERLHMTNARHQKWLYVFGDARIPFSGGRRLPLLSMMIAGYIFVVLTFSGSATPAYAADQAAAPSYGSGPWELMIFTDYFCPPCQAAEKDLEPQLERLLAGGDVKITFVDFPGHKSSSLYAKYFLFSVAANKGHANSLKARNLLFALAVQKKVDQESVLAAVLKSKNIALRTVDPKPVFQQWLAMIKRFEIDQTPTCILRFSSTYSRKFTGSDQIRDQLVPELQKRFPGSKSKG